MIEAQFAAAIFAALHILIQLALSVRVLLRPHREPASRIAWIVVIVAMPVMGIVAYILLGEVNIGRHGSNGCERRWRGCRTPTKLQERTRRTCRPTYQNAMRTCFGWGIRSTDLIRSAATGRI